MHFWFVPTETPTSLCQFTANLLMPALFIALMKTPPNNLKDIFIESILQAHASSKKYAKLFEQFSELAYTDEIRSALAPSRNTLEEQTERLAQILKLLQLRPSRILNEMDETLLTKGKEVCGYQKQQSLHKDVQILLLSKLISYHKISIGSSIAEMSRVLGLDQISQLLTQSVSDDKNAAAYFLQIEQNILYPAVAKLDKQ